MSSMLLDSQCIYLKDIHSLRCGSWWKRGVELGSNSHCDSSDVACDVTRQKLMPRHSGVCLLPAHAVELAVLLQAQLVTLARSCNMA